MTSNPLIAKYEEIYGQKEKPKLPRIEDYEGEKTIADEVKDEDYILNKYLKNLNFPYAPPQSVTTSNTGTTAANPFSITKLTSYDTHSGEDSFLQIAEKVKNKDARVTSVSYSHDSAGIFTTELTTITFEVQVWDTP